jgi:hypothetical protein
MARAKREAAWQHVVSLPRPDHNAAAIDDFLAA